MFKKLSIVLVLASATISLSSCISTPERLVFLSEPLPVPDMPMLPLVQEDALQCVSGEAYEALVRRDVIQSQHIKRLEAIIRSTH